MKKFINKISVQKTGKYYLSNDINNNIKSVWFVVHGYGQLAKDFIEDFDSIANEENLIVAPEALNKYYVNHAKGIVGATWMTKLERDDEINDYTNYLTNVYEEVISRISKKDFQINILGFSQGVPNNYKMDFTKEYKM